MHALSSEAAAAAVPASPAHDLQRRAARALALAALAFGALLVAYSLVQLAWPGLSPAQLALAQGRLTLGGLVVTGAALGALLAARGHARSAVFAVVLLAAAGIAVHAWASGLGIHNLALAALALLLALGCALMGPRVGALLGAVYLAVLLLLVAAELRGLLAGRHAAAALAPASRGVGLALVGLAAWLAGYVLHRLLTHALHEANLEQHRQSQLLRIGSDWTWQTDRHGRIVYLSPSFEAHTGLAGADFLRLGEAGMPTVIDDANWQAQLAALRERRAFRDMPVGYRLPDGGELHVLANGEPFTDATGDFAGWWGMGRNVTAQVLAARESQRSRDLLDRLFATSPDAICVARTDNGAVLVANPAFIAFTGRAEAEVIGQSGRQLRLWVDRDQDLRMRDAMSAGGGKLRDWRTRARRADGSVREVLVTAAAFEWGGAPVAVYIVRDITDIERARLESDAILDHASVGIALVRDRRFQRVNPALERMFGRAVGSLAGQSTEVMFPVRERYEAFIAMSDAAQASGETVDVERDVVRPDGGAIRVHLRGRTVDRARPRESGTIWVVEDVTAARRAEAELAEAKQQAEAANRAKSVFLATMSHEIRTPLNAVLGLARLLQDERDERRRRDYLQHLVGAAEGLAGLVSDVLDLSKIEAGRVLLEDIEFDLHALVTSTFHTFAPLGRERALAMDCRIEPDVPLQVHGDPVRVRQIVSNYLNNALKFTPRGRIDLRCSMAADGCVRLAVTDTGIGIEAAARDRLFVPFSQADSSTTRRFGGTGLGLSICRELAVLMGGRVGAESQAGQGSCFWVELPLKPGPSAARAATQAAEAARALHGLTVLVAEDNPVNMLIVRTLLERLGARVVEAEDGAQAIAAVRRAAPPIDVVLMDLHMPVQDGLAAALALRAEAAFATLPLIALSAAVLEQERSAARAAGMDDFLPKPVSEADLLRALAPLAAKKEKTDR